MPFRDGIHHHMTEKLVSRLFTGFPHFSINSPYPILNFLLITPPLPITPHTAETDIFSAASQKPRFFVLAFHSGIYRIIASRSIHLIYRSYAMLTYAMESPACADDKNIHGGTVL